MNVNKININQTEPTYYIASDIYDVSYHNSGATFESLSALLSDENLSTLIPTEIRCGGMTIRFIQSSDNKYVQYRLMANTFSTDEDEWQGVDDEPTAGSDNLVKSNGIVKMRGIVGVTEHDIASFNRNVISGGGGTNNRIVYWLQQAFIGSGEIYVYASNKRVVISAGTEKNDDYDGNEIVTPWTTITPSTPAIVRFSNSNYVSIKGMITESEEADFLSSLKFRIVWYKINDISDNSIRVSNIHDDMLKTANGAIYFNNGNYPTITYTPDNNIKIKFNSNHSEPNYSETVFSFFNGVYVKVYDAPSLEFTLSNTQALFFDNSKPIYSNDEHTETERIFVTDRITVGDNYLMLLSNTNGIAGGLLSVFAPIREGVISSENIKIIDASKIFDSKKIIESTSSGIDFAKSDIIYGSIQQNHGHIVTSITSRLTTPYVKTTPGMTIHLPTSITRDNITYTVKVRVVGFNSNGESIQAIGNTNSYVTVESILIPDNCYSVRISYGLFIDNTEITNPTLLDGYTDNEFYVHFDNEYSFIYDIKSINENVEELLGKNIITQNKQRKVDAYSMIRTYNSSTISTDNKNFTCLFFSDVHADSVAVERLISLVNDWGTLYFDCVINGGDTVAQNILENVDWYNTLVESTNIPVLTAVGNHDTWTSQSPPTIATPQQTYEAFFETLIAQASIVQPSDAAEKYLMYYYKDFTTRGVRVIVLDCMHWNDAQSAWMQDLLTNAITSNLAVICVTHAPFNNDLTTVEEVTFSSFLGKGGDGTWSNIKMAENIKSFIDNGGVFITWLIGHAHRDVFTTLTNTDIYGNQPCVVISSARGTLPKIFYPDATRNSDDYTRDHLNMIAVDRNLGLFKIMRIGVNKDLQMRPKNFLTYDYVNHRVLSNS